MSNQKNELRAASLNLNDQKAWLITWNPKLWKWIEYQEAVADTQQGKTLKDTWSCNNTHVKPGDRVFLIVIGMGNQNGIIASGQATSQVFEKTHWDPEKERQGKTAREISVEFDCVLDYVNQKILKLDFLKENYPLQEWSPQGSGIEIKTQYVAQIEEEWDRIKRENRLMKSEQESLLASSLAGIQEAVRFYKENISKFWKQEDYKWIAVKHYKSKWNLEAKDFGKMVAEAFSKAFNLLQGGMYYAYKMLCDFSQRYPVKMRELFQILYDEERPLGDRISTFRTGCEELMKQLRETVPGYENKNAYQDLRAICVYLSFEYPDEYFMFKYSEYYEFRKAVNFQGTSIATNEDLRKYENFASLCDEILKVVRADVELQQMQRKLVEANPNAYEDPKFHLLAQTIIWVNKELATKKNNAEKTATGEAPEDDGMEAVRYWIYSPGDGAAIWEECYKSGFMAIGWDEIGDLRSYESKEAMKIAMKERINPTRSYKNAAHATWQFVHDMKPGDVVFVKKGMHTIVGHGVVEGDYYFDDKRDDYKNIRKVRWTHKGEWQHPGQAVMKTLTDITPYTYYVNQLNAIFDDDIDLDDVEQDYDYPAYDAEMFLDEVFMDESSYESLVNLIRTKKNVILQGAPGVGKTYVAKRLAYSMMGEKNPNRVVMVQFHQSYSYEDFIMGFRPNESGFELKTGVFYDFCKEAEIDSENEYFFIIDEINRGNLSKIFGELFMLIEGDKRGAELRLLYSGERFSVPKNVYIIGMMNTADRSLAMMDYALRRRFAFYEMKPGFRVNGFIKYREELGNEKFNNLISCVESLNDAIAQDDSLGEGFCIGHSFFCNLKTVTDQNLQGIVEYELIPLLREYWFDETSKAKDWSNRLREAIK